MPMAALPGVALNVALLGPEDGPPVVLLHGATETFDVSWRRQVPALARHHRVIGPDLRGHGASTNPADRLDLREMADDIVALLDHLDHPSAHVVGFSGGASVALFMALRAPDRLRSLTLISNNFRRDRARAAAGFWDPEHIAARDPHWLGAMARWHAVPPATLLGWWAAEDALRPAFEPSDLAAIRTPTLVVAGDRDAVVPLDESIRLYRALPDARLCVLPGVGHGAPYAGATLLNAALIAFVRQVEVQAHVEAEADRARSAPE